MPRAQIKTPAPCPQCGTINLFPNNRIIRSKLLFCNNSCANQYRGEHRRGNECTCQRCGKAFYLQPAEIGKDGRKGLFCSFDCYKPPVTEHRNFKRGNGAHRTCAACSTSFYVSAAALIVRKADFCSMRCYTLKKGERLQGRHRSPEHSAKISHAKKGKPIPSLRKPGILVRCGYCHRSIQYEGRERFHAQRRRFCSRDCWFMHIRQNAHESGRYRGGRYTFYGRNWDEQKQHCLTRDNDTCQGCGIQQLAPKLDVHHIVPRRVFGGDFESANDLDNLVSLCKPCHTRREAELPRAHPSPVGPPAR